MSSIPLDFFLNDPELLKRHELAIPSDDMYRFFPPKEEILLEDSDPKKNYRFIFNGQQKTEYEQKKLNEFHEYESKTGKLNYPNEWAESETMRLLQASEYDLPKAYGLISDRIKFMNNIPKTINNKIISILNSGSMFVYGRDHHFRPLIVISMVEYKKLIEKKIYEDQDLNNSITYLINYIIKYLLIPGQIENWIALIDFKGAGVSDVSDFKKIMSILNSYRGRVFRNYFINISGFLKLAVKAAINLFGSNTARKVKIIDKEELYKMQELISASNIQKKYGGTAPDLEPGPNNFFPPRMPSMNYEIKGEQLNIISEDAYKEMCLNSNPYKPFTISPKYLQQWNKEKEEKEVKEQVETKENEQASLNVNNQIQQSPLKESVPSPFIGNRAVEQTKIGMIMPNNNKKQTISKDHVISFLNEFKELNMLEAFEEKKYNTKIGVNIKNISSFFQKISNYKKNVII